MNTKLYVASLPFSLSQTELEKIFSTVGTVTAVKLIMDPKTGKGKGIGFVEMATAAEAETAIETLNGSLHGGRTILVSAARNGSNQTSVENHDD